MNGAAPSPEDQLVELYETEWEWRISQLGAQALSSLAPIDDFLPDLGELAQQQRLQHWESVLDKLHNIPIGDISESARVDYAVYEQQLTTLVAQQRFRMYERPANADTSFWGLMASRATRKFETEGDARRYLSQLSDIPRSFAQHTENMRNGLRRGFGPPRISMTGREETIRSVTEGDADSTVFFQSFDTLPESIPADIRDELRDQARIVLREMVIPAYRTLLTFITKDYFPFLPIDIGAYSAPDGEAFYRAQLREFTTTDLSPEQIFEIGQREVASIRGEMEELAAATGFEGDVPGLLHFMRTDPQFYATTAKELLYEAAWQTKKFDGRVHRFFGRTPRMRFGIVEPPADLAPFYTAGRGGLDLYTLNTYNLHSRPLYSLPALTLHEAAPGHAFQIPFALEQTQHPDFRRQVYISAYGEGWALYCERLGVEMEMYETPFEMMGMLSFQMWRASRLIVDPGMHAFGWSRERAQDFLRENTAIADHEIVTEIDRYIAWPGQAASYYLGQLKILELRRRSEAALGAEFCLSNFHDAVLSLGSGPLTVLEERIDRFIETGGHSPFNSDPFGNNPSDSGKDKRNA